jgi:hypothetical protein
MLAPMTRSCTRFIYLMRGREERVICCKRGLIGWFRQISILLVHRGLYTLFLILIHTWFLNTCHCQTSMEDTQAEESAFGACRADGNAQRF